MMVTPRRCQNASKSPAGCCHASEALDRGRFAAGASSASGTREPRGRSEVDRVCRARRPANLKTCKQVRAKYFYEACPSATRADATGVKAPARHPSQCSDPRFRCSMGDVPSTIASSALPPGRLIVRVLKQWVRSLKGNATPRRALTSSASLARGKKQLREAKRSASIRSMRRWVWPIADANRALKAAIRGSVAKAATATLRYEAFEARHCMRRLTPATLGVHLRDLFAMNRNKQHHEY